MKTKLLLAALICSSTMFGAELKQGQLSNVTRVTSDKAVRFENPVWSPDGKQLAFCEEGYEGLYVMNPETKAVKKLSSDLGVGYMFQWSADSKDILVRDTRWVEEGGMKKRVHAAWAVNVDGQKVRLTEDDVNMKPAAWRYDVDGAKKVVAEAKAVKFEFAAVPQRAMKARSLNADVAVQTRYSFVEDCDNLYIVDQDGNKRVLDEGASFNGQLSPDGTKVAFNNYLDEVYVINVDGTGKKLIGKGFRPQWVGNEQLVYERTTDNGHNYTSGELYINSVNGNAEKALTATKNLIEMFPTVSPDGSKIAFSSASDGQIYVADFK